MDGYYPVALNLCGRRVLIIGGGEEAAKKAEALVSTGAFVTVVAERVAGELEQQAVRNAVHWYVRPFTPTDVCGMAIVVLTERNQDLAVVVQRACRARGSWFCAMDQPEYCDWIHMGMVRAGPIQLGVSSSGRAPALVRHLRDELRRAFDSRFVAFAERIVGLRQRVATVPFAERKQVMNAALHGFEIVTEFRYPAWESEPDANADR
jgi:siroheme synthase-like protein